MANDKSKSDSKVVIPELGQKVKENNAYLGIVSESVGSLIFEQLKDAHTYIVDEKDEEATNSVYEVAYKSMEGIDPKDQIEAMLAAQMVATHNMAMNCLHRGITDLGDSHQVRQSELNSATKLLRTFTTQMEALNRHRGKGQQKMIVEHVHVSAGGQAIIGNVTPENKDKTGGSEEGSDIGK